MPSAFKYSANRFNQLLLSDGSVRIGTLYDFRSSEHKSGIADEFEGKKTITHYTEYSSSNDSDSIHTRALSAFSVVELGPGVEIITQGCTFVREINHQDMYVHCVSNVYSKKTASQFEGADSCVEIVNIDDFYMHLTAALNERFPVDFLGVHKVTYMDRNQTWNGFDWDERTNPALIKECAFSDQFELRACWFPKVKAEIRPIIFNCPALTKYCIPRSMPEY